MKIGFGKEYINFNSCVLHSTESVQFSSVAQSCPTLCDPMNRSTPGLPVHHQLPEFREIGLKPFAKVDETSIDYSFKKLNCERK